MRTFLSLFTAALCILTLRAEDTRGLKIDLIAENKAVAAGKPFLLGVTLHHDEGFHTYWKNPGIAGVPVSLEWDLPDGFTAGPIQWPVPERLLMAIHPVHGYQRDVTLLVEITPPAEISTDRLELKAKASWMACADGCYPGTKDLSVRLSVAEQATTDSVVEPIFAAARTELPTALQDWKVELLSPKDAPEVRLRFTPAQALSSPPERPYFFSSDGQLSSSPEQRVIPGTGGSFEILAERSDYSPDGKAILPGVLIAATPWSEGGQRFAAIRPSYSDASPAEVASAVEEEISSITSDCCDPEE